MKKFNCCISFTGLTSSLAQSAMVRLSEAWAPSTYRSYTTMFRLYLAFIIFMDCNIAQVKILDFLAFLECLTFNGVKPAQVNNYVSAIKAYYVRLTLPVSLFDSPQIWGWGCLIAKIFKKLSLLQDL